MSDAVSLLSVLTAVRPGGQTARGGELAGFEALFSQNDTGTGASRSEAAAAPGGAALKTLYNILTGLTKKAAYLGAQGDAPGETLEAVAGLATDLASALAIFEKETGLGLLQQLKAGLPDGGIDGDIVVSSGAGDAAATPADAAAAVRALQTVIASVGGAVQGISAASATPAQNGAGLWARAPAPTTAVSNGEAPVATPVVAAASTIPAATSGGAAAVPASTTASAVATVTAPTVVSAAAVRTPAMARIAAVVSVASGPAGPAVRTSEIGAAAQAPVVAEADAPDAPFTTLPLHIGRSGNVAGPGERALMARVVSAAEAMAQPAGAAEAPNVAALFPGPPPGVGARRAGATDALITTEDIARTLARAGHPGHAPAGGAQAKAPDTGAEPPRFAAALAAQVRSAEVSEGHTRIELSPRGLGSIEVDISTAQDGTLKVVVRAENPAVLNTLRAERDMLALALGGLDSGSLDLQSYSDGGGQEPQGKRAAPAAAVLADDAEPGAGPARAQTAEIGNGRLDIVT
ncbi:flagellar hook-length control protein FliK [Antarcticimicrobium luteum]|uniref:Flagellar hook-length control protein FliK n=1 Tax=Antarcticimicrobium luteum TaxID=2547397 RepID=A0A4R5VD27_9RHOB|nr:flagellar hook-length control protein FliK [Antarcticimicrobium luteum]TDK50219.1 flagellar hook-length control protein FliK [Antarcticimicrobium luteum]